MKSINRKYSLLKTVILLLKNYCTILSFNYTRLSAPLIKYIDVEFVRVKRLMIGNINLVEKRLLMIFSIVLFSSLLANTASGQDGNAGIQEATNKVKGYFDTGCDLMYAIGAVVGIIGAVKVFNKWNAGEPDTNKVAAAWFGSCIFLVVVATVLKSFFGI